MNQPRVYAELDGLRAVAAVAVVATHTGFWAGAYDDGLIGALAHRLEVGVAVFFVLSGFLLGRPHIERALRGTPVEPVRRYYRKRVLRIWPVYLLVVVAALTLVPQNRSAGPGTWLRNLSLTDYATGARLPEGLTQMWSLTVEVCFYLALPLLGWLLARVAGGRFDRLLACLGLIAAASIAYVTLTWWLDSPAAEIARHQLPSYLTWFAAGLLLAVLASDAGTTNPARLTQVTVTLARARLTCWIAASAVLLIVATPLGGPVGLLQPDTAGALVRHLGYGLTALLVVAPCVLAPCETSLLVHRLVRHLGHTSYALFCCHLLVLIGVMALFDLRQFDVSWPLLFALTLAASLVVSELLYRCVERPANRFGHRGSATSATSAAVETTAHH
ncbi:MAG: acyltransferase [Aeromicrobium sp.]|uniref:acyltransferase family protein n=1 Tax=Aeromicrobium sp. TaxID=1871063 RepID=UPI0039E30694